MSYLNINQAEEQSEDGLYDVTQKLDREMKMLRRKREKGSVYDVIYPGPNEFTVIGTNSVVKGHVILGEGVIVGSMVLIEGHDIIIGNGTKIMPFAAIGSKTHIGENCFIGPFFCHANARNPGPNAVIQPLTIGDNCIIGANVMIEPGIIIGNNVKIAMGAYIKNYIPHNYYVPRVGEPRPRNDL